MIYLVTIPIYLWLLWGLYVLVMGLYRAKLDGKLSKPLMVLGAPYLVIGYLMDVAFNLTLGSVIFLELPRELTLSKRLKRHLKDDDGWRYVAAVITCESLLDPLDPTGRHCD